VQVQAGFQLERWLGSDSCGSGLMWTYKAENNDCGTTSSSNDYCKITYEIGSDLYHIYTYSDQACTKQTAEYKVNRADIGKCIKESFITSYRFTLTVVCFPGEAQVQLSSSENVKLSDLKIGQSIASYGGSEKYSEVYAFLDHQPDVNLDFNELHYIEDDGKMGKFAVSHEHLVLARRMGGDKLFVQSKDVKVGDYLYKNTNGSLVSVEVTSISTGRYKGAIAPATMDGTLLVDGIVTSSYAAVNHDISHAVLAPLRWVYRLSPSLIPQHNGGLHPYTKFFYETFYSYLQKPRAIYMAPTLDS